MEVRDMFMRINALVIDQVRSIDWLCIFMPSTPKHFPCPGFTYPLDLSDAPISFSFHKIHRFYPNSIPQSPLIAQVEYFAHQATLNVDKGASKLEKARQKKIKRLRVSHLKCICVAPIIFIHFI